MTTGTLKMAAAMNNGTYDDRNDELLLTTAGRPLKQDVATHLRCLVMDSERSLGEQCARWTELKATVDVPEIVVGEICSVIGQAQLLVSQKLTQFVSLINDHDLCRGEKVVSATDLQGFWDMINIPIKDVHLKFAELDECRLNQWTMPKVMVNEAHTPRSGSRKTPKPSPITIANRSAKADYSSPTRRYITEARKRLKSSSDDRLESTVSPLHTPRKREL